MDVLATVNSEVLSLLSTVTPPESTTGLPFRSQEMLGEGSPVAEHDNEEAAPSATITPTGLEKMAGAVGWAKHIKVNKTINSKYSTKFSWSYKVLFCFICCCCCLVVAVVVVVCLFINFVVIIQELNFTPSL